MSCPLKPAACRSIKPALTDIRIRIRSADCALSAPRAEASDRMRSGSITVGSMSTGSTALMPSPVHWCSTISGSSLSPHSLSVASTSRVQPPLDLLLLQHRARAVSDHVEGECHAQPQPEPRRPFPHSRFDKA